MKDRRILFVLNPHSGTCDNDFEHEIKSFFSGKSGFEIQFFIPDWNENVKESLKEKLCQTDFDTVVASGGDGTVTFVSEVVYGRNLHLGILPTGSANGLAKNLNISTDVIEALNLIEKGETKKLSSLTVNGKFCIHLADVGINAEIIKEFESQEKRGVWGYFLALKNVIFKQKKVRAKIETDTDNFEKEVFMLVFSNGTGYGTGFTINPNGEFDDNVFEIVMIKKISLLKGLQLYWTNQKPPEDHMEIISCKNTNVGFSRKVHLQIDGEYLGLVSEVEVALNEEFIDVVC